MHRARAFTLVEVLVVIGIIAAIMGILLPSISRAREQAMDVRCSANMRTLGQVLLSYATENKDRYPSHTGGGRWLWDLPYPTRDALLKSGATRASLYCPIYEDQDVNELWDYPNFAVTGYFWLTKRLDGEYPGGVDGDPSLAPSPAAPGTGTRRLAYQSKMLSKRSTAIELVTDATISQGTDGNPDIGKFMNVQGGYVRPHDSSHVNGSDRPRGGNILFMDNHVEWRPFRDMVMRADMTEVEFWY